jgi:hypothetical protein
MKTKFAKTALMVTIVFAVFSTIPVCLAQDETVSYQLLNHPDGNVTYQLNVAVPESLYEYYAEKSHAVASSDDFSNFVTPYALEPIADNLWKIYDNGEDFTNGVLMLVHQITYEETSPVNYPVETIVNKNGDCDLFAFIATSILKAGGFDAVLLYFEEQSHMNIGVHLPDAPKDARNDAYSITHHGVTYYVAECTGGNWKEGWRVGECPTDLKKVSAQVITLENAEQVALGRVSASFTTLKTSALSLEVTPALSLQKTAITVRGQLTPEIPDKNVTLYVQVNNSPWTTMGTATTKSDGRFEYILMTQTAGLYTIRASWSGDEVYTGSISSPNSATIIPLFLGALIAASILAAVIGAVAVLISKHAQQPLETC